MSAWTNFRNKISAWFKSKVDEANRPVIKPVNYTVPVQPAVVPQPVPVPVNFPQPAPVPMEVPVQTKPVQIVLPQPPAVASVVSAPTTVGNPTTTVEFGPTDPGPMFGPTPQWRSFRFNPADTYFKRNFNFLAQTDVDAAFAYGLGHVAVMLGEENVLKRAVDAAMGGNYGNPLINAFNDGVPWDSQVGYSLGLQKGWLPPKVEALPKNLSHIQVQRYINGQWQIQEIDLPN